jgi:hypothetical protein
MEYITVNYDAMTRLQDNSGEKRSKAQALASAIRISATIFHADGLDVRIALKVWIAAYLETRQIRGEFTRQTVWHEEAARCADVYVGFDYQLQDWITVTLLPSN